MREVCFSMSLASPEMRERLSGPKGQENSPPNHQNPSPTPTFGSAQQYSRPPTIRYPGTRQACERESSDKPPLKFPLGQIQYARERAMWQIIADKQYFNAPVDWEQVKDCGRLRMSIWAYSRPHPLAQTNGTPQAFWRTLTNSSETGVCPRKPATHRSSNSRLGDDHDGRR